MALLIDHNFFIHLSPLCRFHQVLATVLYFNFKKFGPFPLRHKTTDQRRSNLFTAHFKHHLVDLGQNNTVHDRFTDRAYSLTWLAAMQIYWNKRKFLHKKRVQLPQDWFGTPTWLP